MVVRRLSSELYHHGIKGQRWGVRRFQNTDGSLTKAGRQQYGIGDGRKKSTGKSKGVHRRGEGLGTGPVGRQDKYVGRMNRFSDNYSSFAKKQKYKNLKDYDSFKFKVDPSIKGSSVRYNSTISSSGGGKSEFNMVFGTQKDYDEWAKAMGLDDKSLESLYKSYLSEMSEAEAQDALISHISTVIDTNVGLLKAKGELNFDTSNPNYNPDFPYTAYTNLSDMGKLDPALEINGLFNDVSSSASNKPSSKEAIMRRQRYYAEAERSKKEAQERLKNSKKFVNKMKRFGDAYTEVHSENIEKGINFVKKLFKRK